MFSRFCTSGFKIFPKSRCISFKRSTGLVPLQNSATGGGHPTWLGNARISYSALSCLLLASTTLACRFTSIDSVRVVCNIIWCERQSGRHCYQCLRCSVIVSVVGGCGWQSCTITQPRPFSLTSIAEGTWAHATYITDSIYERSSCDLSMQPEMRHRNLPRITTLVGAIPIGSASAIPAILRFSWQSHAFLCESIADIALWKHNHHRDME